MIGLKRARALGAPVSALSAIFPLLIHIAIADWLQMSVHFVPEIKKLNIKSKLDLNIDTT